MATDIVIVYAYLDTLAGHARAAAELLDGSSSAMNLTFTGNPGVTGAYDDFVGRWDRHRDTLSEGVSAAAEAFEAVSAAFLATEDALIAALAGES